MPEIITLDGFRVDIAPVEDTDNVKVMLTDTMIPRQYQLHLDAEAAKTIGEALIAPRVVQPPKPQIVVPG